MFSYTVHALAAVLTALSLFISAELGAAQPQTIPSSTRSEQTDHPHTPAVIRVLQSDSTASYALQQAAELYTKETGANVVFHIQTVSGRNDYRAALRSKLLSGESIDLFHLLDIADAQRLSDTLADLSSLRWTQDAYPGQLHMLNDAHAYGIPYALEGVGLIVNRAVCSAAGISLENITDSRSLQKAIIDLQAAIDGGELDDAFPRLTAVTDLAIMESDYLGGCVAELLLTDAFTTPAHANASLSLETPAAEPCEAFLRLMAAASPHRGNWEGFTQITRQQLIEKELAEEQIALVLENTAVYPRIQKANPEITSQLALLPIYLNEVNEDEDETGHLFAGSPAWWGINSESDAVVQQHAANFLEWLYTSETGTRLLAEEFHILSPYPASPEPEAALYRQLLAAIETETTSPQMIYETPSGWRDQTAVPQIREYFTSKAKTWEEVVEACQADWRQRRNTHP